MVGGPEEHRGAGATEERLRSDLLWLPATQSGLRSSGRAAIRVHSSVGLPGLLSVPHAAGELSALWGSGGRSPLGQRVRLVAATNRNLTQMMGDKLFRSDLHYRLKVFPIITPPLRDHPEDIPILARHFTKKYAAKMDRKIEKIPSDTMQALASWPWTGNVRELENFIERSVILSRGPSLRAPLAELRADAHEAASSGTLEEMEREHILRVFRETGGVISTAATRLGVPRTTLNAMMKKLGISRSD